MAFLVALSRGDKMYKKVQDVNQKKAKKFKELRIDELLTFLENHRQMAYVPDRNQVSKYDRHFLVCLCQTLEPSDFKDLCESAQQRSYALQQAKNPRLQEVAFVPEIANIILNTNRVSSKRHAKGFLQLRGNLPRQQRAQVEVDLDAHMQTANNSGTREELRQTRSRLE